MYTNRARRACNREAKKSLPSPFALSGLARQAFSRFSVRFLCEGPAPFAACRLPNGVNSLRAFLDLACQDARLASPPPPFGFLSGRRDSFAPACVPARHFAKP